MIPMLPTLSVIPTPMPTVGLADLLGPVVPLALAAILAALLVLIIAMARAPRAPRSDGGLARNASAAGQDLRLESPVRDAA